MHVWPQISGKIPLKKLDEKQDRIIKYCESQIDDILKIFRTKKHDPPLPRMYPPMAGRYNKHHKLVYSIIIPIGRYIIHITTYIPLYLRITYLLAKLI